MSESLFELKKSFRNVFPDYAKALDSAKSDSEIWSLQRTFLKEAQNNLALALNKKPDDLLFVDQTAPVTLTSKAYKRLINARGNEIEIQLHVILDGLHRIKGMSKNNAAEITAELVVTGLISLGALAYKAASRELIVGAVEAAAAYAGVEFATAAVVCAIAAVVVIAIVVPILYFFFKPASCIVFLINELDDDLTFKKDHLVHGKTTLRTTPIPPAVVIPKVETFATGGFINALKNEGAYIGPQYGFTFSYKDKDLTFGVENPLTNIYQDNNCFCGIGISAEDAAAKTKSKNVQYCENSKDGITLSIRCNSGSGAIAYYVARAYKTPA